MHYHSTDNDGWQQPNGPFAGPWSTVDAVDLAIPKTPPKAPPWRITAATAPHVVARTRDWANTQPLRGRQKKKPCGDNTLWQPRRHDTAKFITNERKGFKHELKCAVAAFDKLPAQPTQALLEDASQHLERCYRKLFFLDKCGIVLKRKFNGPETQIVMTREQIRQNDKLRLEENAPMIDTWFEEAQAVSFERGDHRPTTLKASSSATPLPPWATPLPPRVPPPPPIPDVSPPPPLWSSDVRPSKPAPAVATRHSGDSSSDEPPPPSEPPPPITYIPPTGTIIAVAAKAAPPAINAPPAACGPPARAAPVSEATLEVECYATSDQVVERLSYSNQENVPLGVRWTLYEPGKTRRATGSTKRIVTPAGTAPPHVPMPTRPVPMIVFQAHEIHPSQEVDWTLGRGEDAEMKLRGIRNSMIKDLLVSKRSVQYRASGGSLKPWVYPGDVTVWEPIADHASLVVGDVVFCAVQPGDRIYGHMIHEIGDWYGATFWRIGNLHKPHPRINGWCHAEHIFGRLMEVWYLQPITSYTS